MADVIGVESLTKKYGDLVAVDDISFSVQRGEVFGILGPNGAGKTTTLECIEGLLTPTAGSISVLGMDIADDAERIKRRIGVQLQASAYFDYLTLREILDLFALIYRSSASPDVLLKAVGLDDKADTTVAKLSGGQQQRFTIAATLVNDPELLFLDEPTAGLDPKARRDLWEFIQNANRQGRTIVLTTHYMEEAEFLCDRVAIMDLGKIVALAAPAELVHTLPTPYRISVGLDDGHHTEGLDSLACVSEMLRDRDGNTVLHSSDSAATIPALMEWVSSTGARITHLEVTPANLEDVFLSLTGRQLGVEDEE